MKNSKWLIVSGPYRKYWWMRLICFLFGHQMKRIRSYGIIYKQCKKCGKEIFKKRGKIVEGIQKVLSKGKVGNLHGVRLISTKSFKGGLNEL